MAKYKRGLVIGKFYPPHLGHKFLIDRACSQVEKLTIIICKRPWEQPPAELRAEWLRQIHPTVEVILVDDVVPDDDSEGWAKYTIEMLGYAPDVVFTSEDYGDRYAYFLGCKHIQVDKARVTVPCSGTMVRSNPLASWDYLEPCVRAYYVKRVCVLGAESTGTTTMAAALADHYKTLWVPEYGREYSEFKLHTQSPTEWHTSEFIHIAKEQIRREDLAACKANRILICDTDAFATSIWHRRYMNSSSPELEEIAATRKYDLYLLTDADIPFVQDGLRDGEHIRDWMHKVLLDELQSKDKKFAVLSGPHYFRLAQAIKLIDPLLV